MIDIFGIVVISYYILRLSEKIFSSHGFDFKSGDYGRIADYYYELDRL